MALKLSILIATMPARSEQLKNLIDSLEDQYEGPEVEIITDNRMDITVGKKRNDLLARASGEYIVFIDDDDVVSPEYISLILKAIMSKPDCVGICGEITTDGMNLKKWSISKAYGRWYEDKNVYYRTPNHISPVKREIAIKVGFPDKNFAEDFDYSTRLLPHLKTETIILEPIYHYKYVTKK